MSEVKLNLDEHGRGAFVVKEGEEQLGEMVISTHGENLTVYHTEVSPEAEGQGLAKKMLNAMTDYARKNKLKVIPLCQFVHAQFKRHPEDYADLWKPNEE